MKILSSRLVVRGLARLKKSENGASGCFATEVDRPEASMAQPYLQELFGSQLPRELTANKIISAGRRNR